MAKQLYNVCYDAPDGVRMYCMHNCDYETAHRMFARFVEMYFTESGEPRAFPNGKGVYPYRNPRVVVLT